MIGPLDPARMVEIVDELLADAEERGRDGRAPSSVWWGKAQPPTTTVPFISGWMSHSK